MTRIGQENRIARVVARDQPLECLFEDEVLTEISQTGEERALTAIMLAPVGSKGVPRFSGASVIMTISWWFAENPRSWAKYWRIFMASLIHPFS